MGYRMKTLLIIIVSVFGTAEGGAHVAIEFHNFTSEAACMVARDVLRGTHDVDSDDGRWIRGKYLSKAECVKP